MQLLAIMAARFITADRRNYRLTEVYKIGQLLYVLVLLLWFSSVPPDSYNQLCFVLLCLRSRLEAPQSGLFKMLGRNALNNSEAFAETTGNAAVVRAWDFKKSQEEGRKEALSTLAAQQFCGEAWNQAKPDASAGTPGYAKKNMGLAVGRVAVWLVRLAVGIAAPGAELPVVRPAKNGLMATMPTIGVATPVRAPAGLCLLSLSSVAPNLGRRSTHPFSRYIGRPQTRSAVRVGLRHPRVSGRWVPGPRLPWHEHRLQAGRVWAPLVRRMSGLSHLLSRHREEDHCGVSADERAHGSGRSGASSGCR
jgi:hypothetical protein